MHIPPIPLSDLTFSQGKLLNRLQKGFTTLKSTLTDTIIQKYHIDIEDLPCWEEQPERQVYVAKLCRDFLRYGLGEVHTLESLKPEDKPTHEVAKGVDAEDGSAGLLDEEDADLRASSRAQRIADLVRSEV